MTTKTLWSDMVATRRERKAARAHRRELERSLAVYTSHSEIEDMLAAVEGNDSQDAELVRTILTHSLSYDMSTRAHLRAPIAA